MALDLSIRHDLWLKRLPSSPSDGGRVEALVVRPPGSVGVRESRDSAEVLSDGLEGDKWRHDDEAPDGSQVSLINVHMSRAVAGAGSVLTGDNLHVDLDLSEANLPIGTRLEIGTCVLEVSEVPHRPCKAFLERFGAAAAKRVARAGRTGRRGRGVMCRVAQPGTISVSDGIRVLRPGP
ncbi:MAG: MOSC domain-containing protein [Planctomycetota bacterium]|nr:MOSC domain-containing protein [Planctomycetota bacterium]